ncbi:MAG: HEAT repeat domain-containing protein [Caulobacteraceae bacterium]
MARGPAATEAVVHGLRHESADARYHCCRLLDQLLTPDALAPLINMLDDPDERVRYTALHSLSCDRCKDDVCLPTDGPLLAKALELLAADPSAHVRAHAIEAVGRSVHEDDVALAAIARAAAGDACAAVRKKARWYAPGGPIYRRTAPRTRPQGPAPDATRPLRPARCPRR